MKPKPTTILWELISRLAHATLTIFISGEPGTGKEGIARLIASHYPHKNSVFSEFNCKKLKMQSEAQDETPTAHGTLAEFLNILDAPRYHIIFLKDIGQLTGDLQNRLLDMLHKNHHPAAPWIITSSLNPLEESGLGDQLMKALDTIHIALPPLRDSTDTIRQMFAWLTSRNEGVDRFAPDMATMDRLTRYQWPGNWRQLQRVTRTCLDTKGINFKLESLDLDDYGEEEQLDELAAIYILSLAKLHMQKERVLEGLMRSSNLDEIGLLDLAIFHEAVSQIADHFNTPRSRQQSD